MPSELPLDFLERRPGNRHLAAAGHLLGASQHGHIAAIGFEAYARILEEAVAELKGEPMPLNTLAGYVEADRGRLKRAVGSMAGDDLLALLKHPQKKQPRLKKKRCRQKTKR